VTSPAPAAPSGPPPPADLTVRVFRALYQAFDLHTIGATQIAVPKGTPWYAGPSLGALARQISAGPGPVSDPGAAGHHQGGQPREGPAR
jgi:hypothetical protein